jgi:NADH-quinone oxidoreductase subunit E
MRRRHGWRAVPGKASPRPRRRGATGTGAGAAPRAAADGVEKGATAVEQQVSSVGEPRPPRPAPGGAPLPAKRLVRPGESLSAGDRHAVEAILERHGRQASALLAILQDVQTVTNYLPRTWLEEIARALDVPVTRVFRMATFFRAFSLEPRGRHVCTVCLGTACHVRGAPRLVDKIERDFGIRAGQTTADLSMTLETVNCVGACALGPLVILDGEYHGNMSSTKVDKVLKDVRRAT